VAATACLLWPGITALHRGELTKPAGPWFSIAEVLAALVASLRQELADVLGAHPRAADSRHDLMTTAWRDLHTICTGSASLLHTREVTVRR